MSFFGPMKEGGGDGMSLLMSVRHHRGSYRAMLRTLPVPTRWLWCTPLPTPSTPPPTRAQDFHMLGNCFASAGMDNTVKIWALDTKEVQEAVTQSYLWTPESCVPFHTCFVQVRVVGWGGGSVHVCSTRKGCCVGAPLVKPTTIGSPRNSHTKPHENRHREVRVRKWEGREKGCCSPRLFGKRNVPACGSC